MDTFDTPKLKDRDPAFKDADKSALQAIVQAAVNVELFTIPLYMVSMYSIQGMHQITSKDNDFYQGRLWPGAAPNRNPESDPNPANAQAFNHLFSVFIDEMLHLNLVSNIAKVLGVMPIYNDFALQNKFFGWKCYSPYNTKIPHIIDFDDTIEPYKSIKVQLGALTREQNLLFLAIEQNDEDAKNVIVPEKLGNYFPSAPFDNWESGFQVRDLPMFGTIGSLYKCLWQYIEIEYKDETKLFDYVFNRGSLERDLFNANNAFHKAEYPKMRAMATGEIDSGWAMANILDMINAITDQGEGKGVAEWIRMMRGMLQYAPVKEQFQPDEKALNFNYPNYTDTGKKNDPSGNTVARTKNAVLDHHARFEAIDELLKSGKVVTWDQWHNSGNKWTADMLKTTGYDANKWPLPTAEDIANALNTLKEDHSNHDKLSDAACGSIAGITRVLSGFWTNETTSFPNPSMYGSGDRVSICWAIFGEFPDITRGILPKDPAELYHACQGLHLPNGTVEDNNCASVSVFHSCRGSNGCRAEGGCGFVQQVGQQSSGCGHKLMAENLREPAPLSLPNVIYSAPSDNVCAAFGGCAIPISDSQLYPSPPTGEETGPMELNDFTGPNHIPKKLKQTLTYKKGDKVYDIAWQAYIEVLKSRGIADADLPKQPAPNVLRIAFPPST